MGRKNDSALFFTCSLIEQLGRTLHRRRSDIAAELGDAGLRAIYDHADVLHCEPIEKVADDAIGEFGLTAGSYDNVGQARYVVPDVWTMGKVYARLIEDVSGEDDRVKDTRVLGPPQRAQKNSPAKPRVFQGTFKLWREANSP